jgi:hypothetical protein
MRYSVPLIARLISEDVDDFNGVDSTVFIRNGLIPLDFSEAGVVDFDFEIDPDEKDLMPILDRISKVGGVDAYYLDDLSDEDWMKALEGNNEANNLSYGPVVENMRVVEKEVHPESDEESTTVTFSILIDVNIEKFLEGMSKGIYACQYDWTIEQFRDENIKIVRTKTDYDVEKAIKRIAEYGEIEKAARLERRKMRDQ